MDPITLGLLSAAAPSILDLFTGASKKQASAQADQTNQMQQMLNRLGVDMGAGVADSTSYKTSQALNNKAYDRQALGLNRNAAASGMSSEAKLGGLALMNDSYNTANLNAMQIAEQERKRLQAQRDQLQMSLSGMKLGQANTLAQGTQQMGAGIMQMVPYLMSQKTPVGEVK